MQVMIDGPYGGCSVDLGEHETALLFAGGSGITFTLGILDDIVGRVVRRGRRYGERTRRIEFAWCVRSFGAYFPISHLCFKSLKSILIRLHRLVCSRAHGYRACRGIIRIFTYTPGTAHFDLRDMSMQPRSDSTHTQLLRHDHSPERIPRPARPHRRRASTNSRAEIARVVCVGRL